MADLTKKNTPAGPIEPRAAARAWLETGRPVAIATVIETWGSAPVRAGGQMAIASHDEFQGSVSGGCVEGDVISAALDVIEGGKPVTLDYGVADQKAWEVGLACGGRIRVHVERYAPGPDTEQLAQIDELAAKRQPLVIAQRLSDAKRTLHTTQADAPAAIAEALQKGQSALAVLDGTETFLHAIAPAPRIVIVGATHIAQHIAAMARTCGYDVKVIDPRETFASTSRFNGENLVTGWPDTDDFRDLTDDFFSAVVTLTHVDHIDDEAIAIALKSRCRYIGALGSRKTHAKRCERLLQAGFSPADTARIHAPVGLRIGAVTVGEIAVSILAEIIAAFRNAPTS